MSAAEPLVAVVDQGSTATKGAVVAADGAVLAEAARPVARTADGARVEHDPEELVASVEEVLARLTRTAAPAAIGVTCQRSTCLVWERADGAPLTRALSWQDRRESARVAVLAGHAAAVAERTGLRLSPYYAAPKLAGLLAGLPDGAARAGSGELVAGTLDAFLLQRLTGRASTEPGHAGRMLLYGLAAGEWDPWLCELFAVPAAALPPVLPSAAERGRWNGVPITAAAGDQQAALLGHGGWQSGVAATHFGTGAFVLAACGERPQRGDGLLSAVLASTPAGRRFQLEGSVNSAGSAVDWACRLTGERLEAWREQPLDPRRLPRVLPAFAGLAAPWWRPAARAAIEGLTPEHGPRELVAGVLAGVAQRVVDCAEAIRAAGVEIAALRVSGKLTRLAGLTALVADLAQLPVEVSAQEETGLAGIARLARAGLTGDPAPLAEPAARRALVEPRWSAAEAGEEREAWRAFVERVT